ncbi:DNA polymerase III subunit alpha [Candidatus Tenderia electrophaga]|uniref:DNA polymerase III subunit alpha n=1 Tax=Candidatus Tenderia electrophaga TaxID=1748243 RepID=A0A0S2THZ9_9GAMM|nr:DNA polymerase III subunit alpha [Candidatus Tenderia electrophaga]
MPAPSFIHLRVHSEYSLVNGITRIKPLVKAARAAGMPALALTDQCNMFAMVKFYKAALAEGLKPIMGADLWLFEDENHGQLSRLVLLCQNRAGYLNLSRLITRAYREGQHRGMATIQRAWLEGSSDGLIALSGGRQGDVGQQLISGHPEQAAKLLADWQRLFPQRYYLELQRTGRENEEFYIQQAVALASQAEVPVVATNDVHFLKREDFEAHEVRVCIHDGRTLDDKRRPKHYSDQQYLRTPEEMVELFSDIPEALENTVEIARRCNLPLTLGKYVLPDFPIPGGMTEDEYFRQRARDGLTQRLRLLFDPAAPDFEQRCRPYWERLQIELDVILGMGFPGYFLIVSDFIAWAKRNGIPVGPGRGSGAGSLVAYALLITDLDPLAYDLLFERFLNPERVSMPDFDVDFCMDRRDAVIDYVVQTYGRDQVSQIITYGSMAAKAVVRDVGRVFGHPYGLVDRIAKLIPFEIGMTLEKALQQEEQLRELCEQDEDVNTLIEMARALEGTARNAGKHAGGVVIAPTALTDFCPLYCEPGGANLVTQFDKDDAEAVGLVKFDFLGLRTLTIIDWALKAVNDLRQKQGEAPLDITQLPLDDEQSFRLLKNCETTAVFQLESRGMKDLIKRLQPDSFEDIIALVALFRPGPLESGMVDDFINRKHGRARVEYPFPETEEILGPTYGVIVYQEQVMQISQVIGGYSLGGADLLRRAMGKKKPEEMAKQRKLFMAGAQKGGFDTEKAGALFDLMEKFAGYGFNKSHSAAYALVSYQTMWLKAHYPAAFMAAVLSADMDNTDKVVMLIEECRQMQLTVQTPDINRCMTKFTVADDGSVLYGLGAIKGVGTGALEAIIAEREDHGAFRNLFDFCKRIDLRKANRRLLEALIRAGALDRLGPNRATLMASLPAAIQTAEQFHQNRNAGVSDMFGFDAPQPDDALVDFVHAQDWPDKLRLQGEKETLGLYLTGHPIDRYETELERFVSCRLAGLNPDRNQTVIIAGLVVAVRTMNTKRGDRIAFVTLDDRTGRIETAVFSEGYQKYRDLLVKDRVLVVEGTVSVDEYSGGFRMSSDHVYEFEQARERFAKRLEIRIGPEQAANGFVDSLGQILKPFNEGGCPVWLDYAGQGAQVKLVLGNAWQVRPTDELLLRLGELAGNDHVNLVYA